MKQLINKQDNNSSRNRFNMTQQTTPVLQRKLSNESIGSNKLRRSSSERTKKFKESKLEISQVYLKINDQLSNSMITLQKQSQNNSPTKINKVIKKSLLGNQRTSRFAQEKFIQYTKRPLTPHRTQQQLLRRKDTNSKQSKVQIQQLNKAINQKDIQLAVMQDSMNKIQIENRNLKKIVLELEKEKNKLNSNWTRHQRRIQQLEAELKLKTDKLSLLESTLMQNETNLTQTKNSLEKLKRVIKESRMNQLELENKRFQQRLEELAKQNKIIKIQNSDLVEKIENLNKEISGLNARLIKIESSNVTKEKSFQIESMKQQYLNKQIIHLKDRLVNSKDEREKIMEQTIEMLRAQLSSCSQKMQKQQIKIDCLSRKQRQSIQEIKRQKEQQYQHLKQRFRKFLVQYQKFRKQYNELKIQASNLRNSCKACKTSCSDESFHYSLTPEKC